MPDLPVDDAAFAFDAWARKARAGRVTTGAGTLRIERVTDGSAFPGRALGPVARAYGWLRTRAFTYARVELELSAWSTTKSEVGLRYAGRRRPGALAGSAYNRAGPELIDLVGAAVAARARGEADRQAA